jgi:hypothetical protein
VAIVWERAQEEAAKQQRKRGPTQADVSTAREALRSQLETQGLLRAAPKAFQLSAAERMANAEAARQTRIAANQERIAASAPAGSQTVDVSTIGRTPEELERKRKADEVQAVWDEKDAETAAKIKGDYQALAEAFTKADAALKTYRSTLKNLITLNGSAYINQLRQYQSPISGFNAIEHDIEIISTQWREHLVVIAEQLTTEQGPSTINFDDPNLVEVEVNQ